MRARSAAPFTAMRRGPFELAPAPRPYIYVYVNVSPSMAVAPRPAARTKQTAQTFTITELAQEFDITSRAIRFYEDMGLLMPERDGRNRVYTQRDRTRLKLTLRGKRLGLSLSEIKQLVEMYDSPSDTALQLQAFMAVLTDHRTQLERQREDIEITLAEITQHEQRCRGLLAAARGKSGRKRPPGPGG
jgi:DNA-binding transcriptional MerR regulator